MYSYYSPNLKWYMCTTKCTCMFGLPQNYEEFAHVTSLVLFCSSDFLHVIFIMSKYCETRRCDLYMDQHTKMHSVMKVCCCWSCIEPVWLSQFSYWNKPVDKPVYFIGVVPECFIESHCVLAPCVTSLHVLTWITISSSKSKINFVVVVDYSPANNNIKLWHNQTCVCNWF